MAALTEREQNIVAFIESQIESKGYPPSVREIAGAVNLNSTAAVHSNLCRLEKKGVLRRDPSKPRAIEVVEKFATISKTPILKIPLRGCIQNGEVIEQENGKQPKAIAMPRTFLPSGAGALYKVEDDLCFTKTVAAGDFVIVDSKESEMKKDDLILLKSEGKTFLGRLTQLKPNVRAMRACNGAKTNRVVRPGDIRGKITAIFRNLD